MNGTHKTLFDIFDAITDTAAAEYLEINAASPESVDVYATNGMNIHLNPEQCKLVYDKLREYIRDKDAINNSGEFDNRFWIPLKEHEI